MGGGLILKIYQKCFFLEPNNDKHSGYTTSGMFLSAPGSVSHKYKINILPWLILYSTNFIPMFDSFTVSLQGINYWSNSMQFLQMQPSLFLSTV